MVEKHTDRDVEIVGLQQAVVHTSEEPSLNEFDNRINAARTLIPDPEGRLKAVIELVDLLPPEWPDTQKAELGHALLNYILREITSEE